MRFSYNILDGILLNLKCKGLFSNFHVFERHIKIFHSPVQYPNVPTAETVTNWNSRQVSLVGGGTQALDLSLAAFPECIRRKVGFKAELGRRLSFWDVAIHTRPELLCQTSAFVTGFFYVNVCVGFLQF